METTEHENGTGGKFRKWPLRRVSYTPYARPPLAARGIYGFPPETEAGVSRWFSKLVDPASRVVVRSASRLLSAFSKGLTAPPGEHTGTFEEVSKVRSSPESREQGENRSVVRLPIHYDGSDRAEQELISRNDTFLGLEQLLKQKNFSRAEVDRLAELLSSRIIEPSTLPSADYKNKGKINEDSSINSSSSQQAGNHEEREKKKANPSELEGQMEQLVNLRENVTSREHINISEEGFDSPIEIARAYMGLKPRKAAPPTLGLQSQICRRDSPLNLWSSNAAAIAPSPPVCFPVIPTHSRNDCMTQKARGRSTLHNLSCSPYRRSFMMTNSTEYSPYKGSNAEPTRSLEWTPSLSNIKHSDHGQRVRQKSCLKDLNFPTHVDTSAKKIFSQEYKHDIDSNGLDNLDCKIPSSVLHAPPHSVEIARKILRHLDKLNSSPPNKSSYGKAVVGDAPFSKSSISASHEGSLKIKANNDSTKLLNAQGSRILEEPSSSNLARITSSASPNKDNIEGEASLMPYILGAEVESCLGMNSSGTSASVTNNSMKSMDSNSHGYTVLSMQKELTVQSALNDKVEPTKAEHGILAYPKEPMEKSFEHSFGYVPTSGLMHIDRDAKASGMAYNERNVSFNLDAACTFNTLSKTLLFSTAATTLADGATPKKEDTRLNAGSLSAVSSSTGNGAPKFQFGSGNSTSYSFTGLSAIS